MYYTYIIETVGEPEHYYVGSTEDLVSRIEAHNSGRSPHTAKFRPRRLEWYCAFRDRPKAEAFEHYLKSASGLAFQKKHL